MRRRRKRTVLRPRPFLWLALVANVAAGFAFSPITAVRKVRVEGAPGWDRERLTAALAPLQDRPCLRIDPTGFEAAALDHPAARSAILNRNLFGSAVLRVGYRNPVARLYSLPEMAVSMDGVVFAMPGLSPDLPTLKRANAPRPYLALAGEEPWAALADVAVRAQEAAPGKKLRIDVDEGGVVCLNIGAGRVVLGSCNDLDAKFRVLRQKLDGDPDYLLRIESLNLTSASEPSIVRKREVRTR